MPMLGNVTVSSIKFSSLDTYYLYYRSLSLMFTLHCTHNLT